MQLDQKIKKQNSRGTLSHYPVCVIVLPLTLPSQPLFHHHLLPSFVEPTTFSLENALFDVNSNWMQDLSTHPSKNHPPKHPSHHHHLPTTCQQPASSLVCCASFTSLTSNIHHHDLCIQWYTWFHILIYQIKLMYCCKRYRLSRPISAQPKLLLTVHLARNG